MPPAELAEALDLAMEAALSLAGTGLDQIGVKILADPTSDKNVHEIKPPQLQDPFHDRPVRDRSPPPDHLDPGAEDVRLLAFPRSPF